MDLWLYVYGNAEFMWTIITSVNFFMHNAMSFFKLSAVLSLLFFAVEATGILPTKGYDWMRFVKVYMLINIFVLIPYPGSITVHDELTNENFVIKPLNSKIPFGLIFPVALASMSVNRLINLYQHNFSIDSNLAYSYSGMNFGANFIQGLDNASSHDDKFDYNLDNYMQNCGFPLLYKKGLLSELKKTGDIFAFLTANSSAARFVQQVDFTSGIKLVQACDVAITDIDKYYNANKDTIMINNASATGVKPTGVQFTRYINSANATTQTLMNISKDAAQTLKQAIGMNMIMTALKNGAQKVGNTSLAQAAYDAEQFQQYKKTGELSGAASARTIPILVGMGYALLFFLYPIMIFMAIAVGSYKAVGVFFQVIIVINLIPLIYEIINYCTTFYLQNKLGVVIQGAAYNYDISSSLYSYTDNMIVAGNWLATSTPLLAYFLVSGTAVAITQVFGHLNDPAKQAANQVGNEQTRGIINVGNANIDNESYNNTQGNKLNTQLSSNTGAPEMRDVTSGGTNTNIGGVDYTQNHKSDMLVKPNFSEMASTSLQNSMSHNRQEMGQLSKQWGQQEQRLHSLANDLQSGSGSKFATGSDDSNSINHVRNLNTEIQAGLKAMSTGGNASSQVQDKLTHDMKEYQKTANELSHSSNQSVRDAFSNSNSLTTSSSRAISETVATSQALNDVTSKQSTLNADYTNEWQQGLRDKGYKPANMTADQQVTSANQFMAEKLNNQYGIKTNLQAPSSSTAGIAHLSNGASSNNVNNNGLDNPDDGSNIAFMGNPVHHNANQKMDEFKNHPGNVVGNQIEEQAVVVGDVGADVALETAKIIKNVAIDSVTPPVKTFNEEALDSMKAISNAQNIKDKK